jgi:hypothetical protein
MANRPGTRWLVAAEFDLPELNLLAAVIHKAIRDYEHGRATERADATLYLAGDNFRIDCAILGLRAERVLALLQPAGRGRRAGLGPQTERRPGQSHLRPLHPGATTSPSATWPASTTPPPPPSPAASPGSSWRLAAAATPT